MLDINFNHNTDLILKVFIKLFLLKKRLNSGRCTHFKQMSYSSVCFIVVITYLSSGIG